MSGAADSAIASAIREPGRWLGHYTTAATAFEHIIPTGQLRMSPYRLMRDPAENKDLVPGTSVAGNPEHPVREWLEAVQKLKEARDRVRLLSLTHDVVDYEPLAEVFGCCWARPRLWEQYADAHRGVCLVFNRDVLENVLRDGLGEDRVHIGEVEYTPAGIAASAATFITDQRLTDPTTRDQAVADYVINHRQDFFFLKTDDWAAEHEFRAVFAGSDAEYVFAGYSRALVAVIVGEKFPNWQVAGAREICTTTDIALRRVRWYNGHPHAGEV
jgi:Protein of unknown function (DUF2971)